MKSPQFSLNDVVMYKSPFTGTEDFIVTGVQICHAGILYFLQNTDADKPDIRSYVPEELLMLSE